MLTVIDKIHAGVNIVEPHAAVVRNIRLPMGFVIAEEVIRFNLQLTDAFHSCIGIPTDPGQAKERNSRVGRLSCRRRCYGHHCVAVCQKQIETALTRKKLYFRIGLTNVSFKPQRELPKSIAQPRLATAVKNRRRSFTQLYIGWYVALRQSSLTQNRI